MPKNSKQKDQLVRQWAFEITAVANEAVSILEAYRLKMVIMQLDSLIQSLKERVLDISRNGDTYGIAHINNNAGEGPSNRPNDPSSMLIRTLRRAVSYEDEDQLFVGFQEVFQRLLDELVKEESRRNVLSIYDMGGLARNLYNSHTRAWICVPQQYIIKSIKGHSEETYLRDLFDDVWHREALPDNNNGSRVILTTRKEDVAEIKISPINFVF